MLISLVSAGTDGIRLTRATMLRAFPGVRHGPVRQAAGVATTCGLLFFPRVAVDDCSSFDIIMMEFSVNCIRIIS